MSHQHHVVQPSDDIEYDPLPLGQEHHQDTLYNQPPSPGPASPSHFSANFPNPSEDHISSSQAGGLPHDAGQPQPRFLGAALYDDGIARPRDSYASSQNTYVGATSDANSSVYALNYGGTTTPDARHSFAGTYRDDPQETYYGEQVPIGSLSQSHGKYLGDKRATYAPPQAKSKRKVIVWAVLGSLALLIAGVVLALYFTVWKKKGGSASDSSTPGAANPSGTTQAAAVTGGDGSTVLTEDGTKFTYSNQFGGTWYWDENDPFNSGAKAQSWTPALNETFQYGTDRIYG
jgi:glucan 1,3-beta-glucosidase